MTNATRNEVLAIIDTYEGMIRLAWARGERAEDLLAYRTYWCAVLAGLS
jgi:hypothetical protein